MGQDKIFGLIGNNLKNTFSKNYYEQKFLENKLNYAYQNFELNEIDGVLDLIKQNENLFGLNVTIPFKQQIIPLLHEIEEDAAIIGAVNCVKITRTKNNFQLKGYNTDCFGFEVSLQNFLPKNFNSSALILGNGGASKAVQFVLNKLKIGFTIVSTNPSSNHSSIINYNQLNDEIIKGHLLIINCTPLGMFPNINFCPQINYEALSENHYCYDLIYLPHETLFLKQAKQKNAKILNGLEMLHEQANMAFDIFIS